MAVNSSERVKYFENFTMYGNGHKNIYSEISSESTVSRVNN